MTAKTHVLGSMSLALGGYILMDKGGLLIPDVEPLIRKNCEIWRLKRFRLILKCLAQRHLKKHYCKNLIT